MEEKELETMQDAPRGGRDQAGDADGPLSRRQALAALSAAAAAAIGIGAIAVFGPRRDDEAEGASLRAKVAKREAKPVGVAYACLPADVDGMETCGAAAGNVASCQAIAVGGAGDEQPGGAAAAAQETPDDGSREKFDGKDSPSCYVTYEFEGLLPGNPYLFSADIMEPAFEKVEDARSYPEGWRFAKKDSAGAYRIASTRSAAETSLVVVPSSPSGRVSAAAPCDGDGLYALATMTMLGAI